VALRSEWVLESDLVLEFDSLVSIADTQSLFSEMRGSARDMIAGCRKALSTLKSVKAQLQHGDFSLNNLVIDEKQIFIIDLDDFGIITTPLHDVIGLAVSYCHFAGLNEDPGTILGTIRECMQGRAILRDEEINALTVCYLLTYIADSSNPRRAVLKARYLRILSKYAEQCF
jgi:Ser/Thr protein kinase RdoA (MazF antagonist)